MVLFGIQLHDILCLKEGADTMSKGVLQYDVGEQVELFLLIKNATKGIASNGKPFLTLIFQDKSGDIEAKLWDASNDDDKKLCSSKYC
jgi:3'-5' exoribonuclease